MMTAILVILLWCSISWFIGCAFEALTRRDPHVELDAEIADCLTAYLAAHDKYERAKNSDQRRKRACARNLIWEQYCDLLDERHALEGERRQMHA